MAEHPDGIYGAEGDDWKYEVKDGRPVAAIRADGKRIPVSIDDEGPAFTAIQRQLISGIIKPMAGEKVEAAEVVEAAPVKAAPEVKKTIVIHYPGMGRRVLTPEDPEWDAMKGMVEESERPPRRSFSDMTMSELDKVMDESDEGMEGSFMRRAAGARRAAKSDLDTEKES